MSKKPITSVEDFEFVKRSTKSFDLVIQRVGQRAGKTIVDDVQRFMDKNADSEEGNFFYIRITDQARKDEIIAKLVELNFENDESKYDTSSSHHSIAKSRICEKYTNE